jgi:hypothetical protein
MTGQSCVLLLVNNKENFKSTHVSLIRPSHWGKIQGQLPMVPSAKPFFMVSCTSSTIELVHETIKNVGLPTRACGEFAPNLGFVN